VITVRKIKRPGGLFTFEMLAIDEDDDGAWVFGPVGSCWTRPEESGTLSFPVLGLFRPGEWFVSWWIDRPEGRRVEADVCLPPERLDDGWSYVDLELDPVRHEPDRVEVQDHDEFEVACENGWMSPDDAAGALDAAARMERALTDRVEPWGDEGWRRLGTAVREYGQR
jgi:hypothetical protein